MGVDVDVRVDVKVKVNVLVNKGLSSTTLGWFGRPWEATLRRVHGFTPLDTRRRATGEDWDGVVWHAGRFGLGRAYS